MKQTSNTPCRPWQEPLRLELEEHWALHQGLVLLHNEPQEEGAWIYSGDQSAPCSVPSSSNPSLTPGEWQPESEAALSKGLPHHLSCHQGATCHLATKLPPGFPPQGLSCHLRNPQSPDTTVAALQLSQEINRNLKQCIVLFDVFSIFAKKKHLFSLQAEFYNRSTKPKISWVALDI